MAVVLHDATDTRRHDHLSLAALMFSNPDTFKESNDTDVCAASGRVL